MYKHISTYRPFVPRAFLYALSIDVLSIDLLSVDLLSIDLFSCIHIPEEFFFQLAGKFKQAISIVIFLNQWNRNHNKYLNKS